MITSSMYRRTFNHNCPAWNPDRAMNLYYLRSVQHYFNDVLRYKKRVLLEDVYAALGFPITEVSRYVGWIFSEDNTVGDNYIDFGLPAEIYDDDDWDVLINFNVDGMIM